jgi:hypothetical protein
MKRVLVMGEARFEFNRGFDVKTFSRNESTAPVSLRVR